MLAQLENSFNFQYEITVDPSGAAYKHYSFMYRHFLSSCLEQSNFFFASVLQSAEIFTPSALLELTFECRYCQRESVNVKRYCFGLQ